MLLSRTLLTALLSVALVPVFLAPVAAQAAIYPTDRCVADKLHATAKLCKTVFDALGTYIRDQDAASIQSSLAQAGSRLEHDWSVAEGRSERAGVSCLETT